MSLRFGPLPAQLFVRNPISKQIRVESALIHSPAAFSPVPKYNSFNLWGANRDHSK